MLVLDLISAWALPVLIAFIPVYGYLRGVKVYESFIEGASQGLDLAIRILPYIVAIMVAMSVFRTSGALEITTSLMRPITSLVGFPAELLPLALIRPLSGGTALGLMAELIRDVGPDSFLGRVAAAMQGSTETTFYVITVYFGSVGITRTRHALTVGLVSDLVGMMAAVLAVTILFYR